MFDRFRVLIPLLCLGAIFTLLGCSSTGTVSLDSVRPAEITFPKDVRRLVIVERSGRDRAYERIESIVTGELPHEDRAGAQALIDELSTGLRGSGIFETVVARERPPGLGLSSAFPATLPWGRVAALCDAYDADAALVIEAFDTDFMVTHGVRVDENAESGPAVRYVAKGVAHVTSGIRVYDPSRRQIIDEKMFVRTNTWEAQGSDAQDAILALIDKSSATRQLSAQLGSMYTQRVSPTPIRLTRSFRSSYKKVPEVERGTRYAEVGKWQQAKSVWESGLERADREGSGYLSYNIALALEVLGDLDGARAWAERSYTEYGYREAREYVRYLDRRRNAEAIAGQQYR